ncbi:protein kinase domain-containing protein [Tardiphaga sp. 215_C5_N2_1]|uniref:protein kinase domain-containing protein n=1 Tax=Tardiphaga sp. 215_C5_N2_1 TaxID=3240774 RepID=UPI003F8B6721
MTAFSIKVSEAVYVEDGLLHLGGKPIDKFEILGTLGDGSNANGVVFNALHRHLKQPRAVKVWMKLRKADRRDKVAQGIAEARKLAASDPDWVVVIHDIEQVGGFLYSSMEKVNGHTLSEALKMRRYSPLHLAGEYWRAISATTTDTLYHGDAHTGNVMVFAEPTHAFKMIKLLDFGTSIFAGRENSLRRHARVVRETFGMIVASYPKAETALMEEVDARGGHMKFDPELYLTAIRRINSERFPDTPYYGDDDL